MFYDNGKNFRIDIYGASHDNFIGVKIYGLKKGERADISLLKEFLKRRKSDGKLSTARTEDDDIQIISGIEGEIIEGDVVDFRIYNKQINREPYLKLKDIPRPSTADYVAIKKGEYKTGGGAYSGRMTAPMCIAGGIVKQFLEKQGVKVYSHIYSVGEVFDTPFDSGNLQQVNSSFPVIDREKGEKMLALIKNAKEQGDSIGGIIECAVTGVPSLLGGAMSDGLESKISDLLFAIPAVKGIEFGAGFKGSQMYGSSYNDQMRYVNGEVEFLSNNDGGIVGGTSNGNTIIVRVAFKPVPSIQKEQKSINLKTKENVDIKISGRHDTAIVLRATPIVESGIIIPLFGEMLKEDEKSIEGYRRNIDYIDDKIGELLSERIKNVKQIGGIKKQTKTPVKDLCRENAIIERLKKQFPSASEYIEEVYREIFKVSIKKEDEE